MGDLGSSFCKRLAHFSGQNGREILAVFKNQFVQTADGLPLMPTVHPGNMAETKTLQAMLATVLKRFSIQRVILVAERGLLSLENIGKLTALAEQGGR